MNKKGTKIDKENVNLFESFCVKEKKLIRYYCSGQPKIKRKRIKQKDSVK